MQPIGSFGGSILLVAQCPKMTNLDKFGPKMGKIGLKMGKFGPKMCKFGPKMGKFGQWTPSWIALPGLQDDKDQVAPGAGT